MLQFGIFDWVEASQALPPSQTYEHKLELAAAAALTSVAFPSISTGIYGYPVDLAAAVALQTVDAWVAEAA